MNACVHTYTEPQTSNTRRRGLGWQIHGSVEDTKLSTNKQHTLSQDALLLCDNEAVLRVIRKWVGQGGKAMLATAPDADILREIICLLTQRVRTGRATFLIKVKSHRGEPINERADTLAEEGRTISDDDKR